MCVSDSKMGFEIACLLRAKASYHDDALAIIFIYVELGTHHFHVNFPQQETNEQKHPVQERYVHQKPMNKSNFIIFILSPGNVQKCAFVL